MLKAIFFDFDGTLSDDDDSIQEALVEACAVVCQRWPELQADELLGTHRRISEATWTDYDRFLRHLSSPQAMMEAVWCQTLSQVGVDDPVSAQAAASTYWQRRLRGCRPCPDVLPVVQQLHNRFHLSVLTNGAPVMQRAKVEASGLTQFFNKVFVGGDFPRGKPDPAIFRAALEAADCCPNQALHIGDSLRHDIAGANEVGIHSVWLNRKGWQYTDLDPTGLIIPRWTITSMEDLPRCIEQIVGNENPFLPLSSIFSKLQS